VYAVGVFPKLEGALLVLRKSTSTDKILIKHILILVKTTETENFDAIGNMD